MFFRSLFSRTESLAQRIRRFSVFSNLAFFVPLGVGILLGEYVLVGLIGGIVVWSVLFHMRSHRIKESSIGLWLHPRRYGLSWTTFLLLWLDTLHAIVVFIYILIRTNPFSVLGASTFVLVAISVLYFLFQAQHRQRKRYGYFLLHGIWHLCAAGAILLATISWHG